MTDRQPVPVPRHMVARKPAYGSPCTRCGACCYAVVCALGQQVFRRKTGPCPALEVDAEGKASCGLTLVPKYGEAAALIIGVGNGCDMRLSTEPPNPEMDAHFERWADSHREAANKARELLES